MSVAIPSSLGHAGENDVEIKVNALLCIHARAHLMCMHVGLRKVEITVNELCVCVCMRVSESNSPIRKSVTTDM